ncbi:MAG: hypothetical protein V2A58_16870 [Planctomycetota bacterium]
MRLGSLHLSVELALTVLVSALPVFATPSYTITDLGVPGQISAAYDVTSSGMVVGVNDSKPAFWDASGSLTTLSAGTGTAYGINEAGEVVGAYNPSSRYLGFYWSTSDPTLRQLIHPHQSSSGWSWAMEITDSSLIVGAADMDATYSYQRRGVIWNGPDDPNPVVLPSLGRDSHAWAANASGEVVGWSSNVSSQSHGFYWDGSTMTDLGTLGGSHSWAYDINDSGTIVGGAYTSSNSEAPVFWTWSGSSWTITQIGSASGQARSINASGDIVGRIQASAFLWQDGSLYSLNDLIPSGSGWDLRYAYSILDNGYIVGQGYLGSVNHAFLLTPTPVSAVPAPGALLLAIAGAVLASSARLLRRP